jgi:aspartyl-tRNA(Asn)/glutamyl-tRNA(Gln) amidotransferase subunit C
MAKESEVLRIAKLAKLRFNDEQLVNFIRQFNSILTMAEKLKTLSCDNVEPLKSVSDFNIRMRADEVVNNNLQDKLFTNAPGVDQANLAKEVKCFIVPKVIE